MEQFFDARTAEEQRRTLVAHYGVAYLFHGPNERELGDYDPSSDPLWRLVYANAQVSIYRANLEDER